MRQRVQWAIAYGAAGLSAALAARYGFKVADSQIDAVLRGIALLFVALISAHSMSWASAAWKGGGKAAGAAIAGAGLLCFVVTLGGGIGTIASSADVGQAIRAQAVDAYSEARAQLASAKDERQRLPAHRPAGTIKADIEGAKADRRWRGSSECSPDSITATATRTFCASYRQLEGELATAERATQLDGRIMDLSARIEKAPAVASGNPQAEFLSRLTGLAPKSADAWFALLVSLAVEAGAMMTMWAAEISASRPKAEQPKPLETAPPVRKPKAPEDRRPAHGPIATFLAERLEGEADARVDVVELMDEYTTWCKARDCLALTGQPFVKEFSRVCEKAGIRLESEGKKVYALDVRLSA